MPALTEDEAFERLAQVIGCKWSVRILETLQAEGKARPSELTRRFRGLSSRVLHRCLNRLEKDGLISKEIFAEIPLHTEYQLTLPGKELLALLTAARKLAARWKGTQKAIKLP